MAQKTLMPGDTVRLKLKVTNPADSDALVNTASGAKAYLKKPDGTVIAAAGTAMATAVTGYYTLGYLIPDAESSEGRWTFVGMSDDNTEKNSDDVTFDVRPKLVRTYP